MLASLRKASNSTPIKILFGLLALLFIVWGVGSVGGQRVDVVAKVHGDTITRREVEVAAANIRSQYDQMLKGQFAGNLFKSFDFHGQALDRLIDDALVRNEAARLGITVTDAELVAAIQAMPAFQENGRFNRDLVQRYLEYQRDRGEFESQIRRGLLFQRVQGLVTDGVQVSDAEVEDRYRTDHEKVDLAFVRVASADVAKDVTLSDEDLQHYLDAHPEAYRQPARVRARYVAYQPADFTGDVQVSDGEVAEQYELHKDDRFTEVEQVRARHILVAVKSDADDKTKAAARKKAEDLHAKAKGGADFAALAKKISDDKATAPQGGDLGLFPHGRMTPTFETAAFALGVGEVSDVVESPFGFHVIKVEEHRQAGPKPLDAVRAEIRQSLVNERAVKRARQQAEEDRRSVVKSRSFTDALTGRRIVETPPFAENDEVPGVGRVVEFSQAAFGLHTGEVSDLLETEEAVPTVYLLSPFERTEARVPPLAEIRDRVTEDARRERSTGLAKERAEAMLAHAKEAGLEKAAAEAGLKVDETGSFERAGGVVPKIGGAPRELRTDAYALTTEAPLAQKVYAAGADTVVVALKSRAPADMTAFAGAKDGLRDSLLQQKRQRVQAAYMDYLKQRAQREGALEVRADALTRG
jgi:peptidyl-prolyl cis-trans isomerase D